MDELLASKTYSLKENENLLDKFSKFVFFFLNFYDDNTIKFYDNFYTKTYSQSFLRESIFKSQTYDALEK